MERNYNIDLLRIIGSIMVVLIHVIGIWFYYFPSVSVEWKVMNVFDSFVRSAVPIFVMISGIYFLKEYNKEDIKKLYINKIFRIIVIFLFWNVIYLLFDIFYRNIEVNLSVILKALMCGPFHLYYLLITIALYAVAPILGKIVKNLDENTARYFVIIFILVACFNTICDVPFLKGVSYLQSLRNLIPINVVLNYGSYFILGYILYNFDIFKKYKKHLYIIALVSILCTILLTYKSTNYMGDYYQDFYDYFSFFTLLESIAIFVFVKNIKLSSDFNTIISKISKCTLGIYIIHIMVLNYIIYMELVYINADNVLIVIPFLTIIVWIISYLLTTLIININKFIM